MDYNEKVNMSTGNISSCANLSTFDLAHNGSGCIPRWY